MYWSAGQSQYLSFVTLVLAQWLHELNSHGNKHGGCVCGFPSWSGHCCCWMVRCQASCYSLESSLPFFSSCSKTFLLSGLPSSNGFRLAYALVFFPFLIDVFIILSLRQELIAESSGLVFRRLVTNKKQSYFLPISVRKIPCRYSDWPESYWHICPLANFHD